MHLLILSHAYPGHIERLYEELSCRGYIDETDPEKTRYPAVWREVRLWDIQLPEGCRDDFLSDISPFVPHPEYLARHRTRLSAAFRWVRRLLHPFGLRSVDIPDEHDSRYFRREINGKSLFIWLEPLGTIPELRDPETGKELL